MHGHDRQPCRARGDLRAGGAAAGRSDRPLGALTATHPFLDHPGPIAFAHRGGAAGQPENTLAAFAAAVDLGFRYVETDVHTTSDGVLIAFHDDRLDRVTDRLGLVAETSWSELRAARVGGREPILRFEELLLTFPEVRINVEPKHDAAVGPLVAAIRQHGALDRICIGSFADRRLAAVRIALGAGVCTSLGTSEVAALRAAAWGVRPFRALLARRPGRCVQVPMRGYGIGLVDSRLVRTAHDLGLPVHVWTINEPVDMNRLLDLGVDGLMSDRPALLRDVLRTRGVWQEPSNG